MTWPVRLVGEGGCWQRGDERLKRMFGLADPERGEAFFTLWEEENIVREERCNLYEYKEI